MAQNNGGGWTTTIDSIQQQQSRSRSLHGVNGVHDQIDTCFPQSRVLRGTTNIISASPASKRLCLDPARKKGIEASRICNVDNDRHTEDVKDPSKQKVACVPGPSQNLLLSLSHSRYGLPDTLVRNFASLGINSIYPWQSSCLLGHGLLTGEKNLVYTAPTGGGKSLVADVLMLKKVIKEPSKKAILVLPYVALVQEKLKWLRKAVEGVEKSVDSVSGSSSQLPKWRQKKHNSSIRVVGFFGGSKARVSWSDVDICVCTIEKVL